MSYNNYVDADAARRAAYDHSEPAVAIIKHANPCGVAVGASLTEAYLRAFDCDRTSAFGGIVALNKPLMKAKMLPGTYQPSSGMPGKLSSGLTFQFTQTLK